MSYEPGVIDTALVAAVGDEPLLIVELRMAFKEGATRALALMEAAHGSDDWRNAASRLKGLAASFGAVRLMTLADDAATGMAGDRAMLAKLRRAIVRL